MSKVSANPVYTESKKGLNRIQKIGAIVVATAVIAAGVFAFGFTTKGQTVIRVMIDHAPAAEVYKAQDAAVDAAKAEFRLQVANPKAE